MTKQRVLAGMFTATACSAAWLVAAIALWWPSNVIGAAVLALVLSGAGAAKLDNQLTWEATKQLQAPPDPSKNLFPDKNVRHLSYHED